MNRVVRTVLQVELRQLLRDRRALFAAVILPALLYPLIFWSTEQIERSGAEMLAATEVLLALDLDGIDPEVAERARALLGQHTPIQLFDVDADELIAFEAEDAGPLDPELANGRRRTHYRRLLDGGGQALVTAARHVKTTSRSVFRVYYDVKDDDSREASERAKRALHDLELQLTRERRGALLGVDPARGLDLEPVDVASAEDSSGASLGRLLPLLAVMVLLSGGSYAALAVFAGERESGTLETLLVQPVEARWVVHGKFLAVLAAGLVTLGTNMGSLVACGLAGIGDLPGFEGGAGPGLARLAMGVIYLPGAALMCAILCLVCGKARTFREGQQTILPVMLATALPSAIVMQPGLETSLLLAMVPFAGAALCVRDALSGDLHLLPTAVMIVAHLGWTALVLAKLGTLLDAERVLADSGPEGGDHQGQRSARFAMRWGFVSVLLMYVLGTRVQGWNLTWGLGLTLWVLVLGLAFACAHRARRVGGAPLARELSLRPPRVAHALGALLCVPLIALAMLEVLMPWLLQVLPMPQSMNADAASAIISAWKTPLLVFLVAISPGVCEELLFRGALLSSFRRDLVAWKAVLAQAFFFAMMHLSVHRLLPTFLLGVLLGALTLRARSLWPAILAHAAYNALQVLPAAERVTWSEWDYWHTMPWLAVPGLVLLIAVRPRD